MSRRETDRALLRAFGDAARLITLRPIDRWPEWMTRDSSSAMSFERLIVDEHALACDWRTSAARRQRVYRRHYAHALATAWGL